MTGSPSRHLRRRPGGILRLLPAIPRLHPPGIDRGYGPERADGAVNMRPQGVMHAPATEASSVHGGAEDRQYNGRTGDCRGPVYQQLDIGSDDQMFSLAGRNKPPMSRMVMIPL